MVKIFLIQAIQFSQTVLFQTIQFSINTHSGSIWLINRILLGATTPDLSGPWSDGKKGVLCVPQSSSITGTSPSDCLVSYVGHSFEGGESHPSAEMQSEYSTALASWVTCWGRGSYPSAEKQSVYSTAPPPADWAILLISYIFMFVVHEHQIKKNKLSSS